MTDTRVGRPRSEQAHDAILDAARDLLNEKGGAATTIEAIARRAGVGKPTIYRRWPSIADIVLEALLRQAEIDIPVPAESSAREALRVFLRRSMNAAAGADGAHLRFLLAHAQSDDSFRERFRDGFTAKRRETLKSILARTDERGETRSRIDPDTAADIVFGVMWYRLLVGHAPLDEALADELTDLVADPIGG